MLRLSAGGDAEGGWLVDVHDGVKHGVYRPEGVTSDAAALVAALHEHDPELLDTLRTETAPVEHHDEQGEAHG